MKKRARTNKLVSYPSELAKTLPTTEFPFDLISKKISFLQMFCKVIDKHPEDLEKSYARQSKKIGFKPSIALREYFVINIAIFYECAGRIFGLKPSQLPSSYPVVKRFRNKIMAHLDQDIKNNLQIVQEYALLNGTDQKGFARIYHQYLRFRNSIFKKLKTDSHATKN